MSVVSANSMLSEIRRLHEDKQSGILSLTNDRGERVDVFFYEGMIEAVSSNLGDHRFGDFLVKDGYLPAGELDAVQQDAQKRKIVFGEAVVRKKLLDHVDVAAAARSQALELIAYALKNGFSADSFTNLLRSYHVPARISFPHILLELSRANTALYELEPGIRIVLREGVDLSAFPWYPQELAVLSALKYPNTFQGLLKSTGVRDASLQRMLGVFQRLGVIDTVGSGDEAAAVARKPEFLFKHLIPVVTNAVLHEKLEVARNGSSFTSEQFKNLKVQLSEANSEAPLKVFTISSPDPQDGKSLVSANLAFSFAMDAGRRTIIIDCDLRGPSLEKYLGVTSEPGLMQCLANGNLDPYCYVRRLENLYFMTAGGTAPNPIEVLSMQKMKQLIEHLREDFDTIILDAPPYSPIADARIVTGLSDGLIMVVRRGKTSYGSADRAFKAIDRNKLIGVVFNDVKPMLFHTYHDFGYYQYGKKQLESTGEKSRSKPKNYLET